MTYWGTTSGKPLPEPLREAYQWTTQQLQREDESILTTWRKTYRLKMAGLREVLFCHSTPRSETEIFTRLTAEDRLRPLFDALEYPVVVCDHTHMQFDRMIGRTRVVNAGRVGEPYAQPGAYWLVLGSQIQFHHTSYQLWQAAERIRATDYPHAEEAVQTLLHTPSEADMLPIFSPWELRSQ